jgi:CheY-like chemotaxis protein
MEQVKAVKETILIVDDEERMRKLIGAYLRKEGYEVSAPTFMKISVPFTLAAVISGYVLNWIIWN